MVESPPTFASALDTFRCDRLHATLTARACVDRQRATRSGAGPYGPHVRNAALHPTCAECPVGKAVAAQVEKLVPPGALLRRPATEPCAVCGSPVRGARGRKPLCPQHRGAA